MNGRVVVLFSCHSIVFSIDRIYNYTDIRSLVPSKEELLEALKKDGRFEVHSEKKCYM